MLFCDESGGDKDDAVRVPVVGEFGKEAEAEGEVPVIWEES